MLDYDLTRAEQVRRTDLAQKARRMILSHMKVEAEDETSLTLDHRGYPHPGVLRTPRMQLRSAMQSLRSCWSGRRLSASVTQASTRCIPPAMGRARFGVISGTSIRFAARSAPIIIPWPPACRVTQRSPASAHEALAAHAAMNSNTTARDIP